MAAAWFEATGTLSTIAAALLAAGAIWQAKKAGDRNAELLVRERRADFDLDVLKDLAELVAQDVHVVTRVSRARVALQLLPPKTVPLCRRHFGLPSTPEADAEHARLVGGMEPRNVAAEIRPALQEEILDAVTALLARRDAGGAP